MGTSRKLTVKQIIAARQERHDSKTPVCDLAKKYNVARTSMSRLLRGITYPGIGGPIEASGSSRPRKINRQEIVAARKMRHDFETPTADLALMYGVNRSSMRRILCGITYKDVGGPIEPGYGARLGERDSQEKRDQNGTNDSLHGTGCLPADSRSR